MMGTLVCSGLILSVTVCMAAYSFLDLLLFMVTCQSRHGVSGDRKLVGTQIFTGLPAYSCIFVIDY
jgi:hypothetical protein